MFFIRFACHQPIDIWEIHQSPTGPHISLFIHPTHHLPHIAASPSHFSSSRGSSAGRGQVESIRRRERTARTQATVGLSFTHLISLSLSHFPLFLLQLRRLWNKGADRGVAGRPGGGDGGRAA
jgi:hypothetical protein